MKKWSYNEAILYVELLISLIYAMNYSSSMPTTIIYVLFVTAFNCCENTVNYLSKLMDLYGISDPDIFNTGKMPYHMWAKYTSYWRFTENQIITCFSLLLSSSLVKEFISRFNFMHCWKMLRCSVMYHILYICLLEMQLMMLFLLKSTSVYFPKEYAIHDKLSFTVLNQPFTALWFLILIQPGFLDLNGPIRIKLQQCTLMDTSKVKLSLCLVTHSNIWAVSTILLGKHLGDKLFHCLQKVIE